jgi:hypothetical protein
MELMAVMNDRDFLIKGLFAEEDVILFDEEEAVKEGLEFSEKCLHNNILVRMDAAYALQKVSAIRLVV